MVNGEYRKYLMPELKDQSNLPYSDDKNIDLCAMFEKVIFMYTQMRIVLRINLLYFYF